MEAINGTKITNLPEECLTEICDNLNMASLFYVSLSNKNLIEPAILAFKRQFSQKTLYVDPYKVCMYKKETVLSENVEFYFTQTCNQFSFLRIFGNSISRIKLIGEIRNECAIQEYVSKYCKNAIVDIEFYIFFSWHSNLTFIPEELCEIDSDTKELAIACEGLSDNLLRKIPLQIQCLSLQCSGSYVYDSCQQFVFDQLKKFTLISDNPVIFEENPPFDFVSLKTLELIGFENVSKKWWNLISKNDGLTKLTLCLSSNVIFRRKTIRKRILRKLLSHLEILEINIQLIDVDFLLKTLIQSKTIMEVRLLWESSFNDDISITLPNVPRGWTYYAGPYRAALINKKIQN